ncbi:hypothetical protein [Aliterella atlantica]|uniref:Uncharacterized protein n=1 Tax=Aliterella atlantica CENA595 TaxID=1618023 RepID=A0A0D8ZUF7_9CYAN|nr:hypothetical protein [Aliterella atlantica]KJH72355.1 hypothetical protein UH38_08075 [Aliterella atlantica CENA595]
MTNFDLIQNRLERLEAAVERREESAKEDRVNFQQYRERNDVQMASLNAIVKRLDEILDRLIRQE